MTPEIKQQAEAQFRAEVTSRYTDKVEKALDTVLTELYCTILTQWEKIPGYANAIASARTLLDAAFKPSRSTVTPQTKQYADIYTTKEATIETLIGARSLYTGYKNQMLNPQLLAQQAIEKRMAEACDQHGVAYEGSQLQKAVREAMQPLSRLPQLVDMQGMGL